MLRSLALASLLLAPVSAQALKFPGGKGTVGHPNLAVLPIDWQGKPALLLLGTPGRFIDYEVQAPPNIGTPTPVCRLAAAMFMDWRPCAAQPWVDGSASGPSSEAFLNIGPDIQPVLSFGNIGKDGSLLWMPANGGQRIAFDRWIYSLYNKSFHAGSYIRATETVVRSNCPPQPGTPGTAQFMALVLVIEGFAW